MTVKEKEDTVKDPTPVFHLQCFEFWKDLYNEGSIQIRNYANQMSNFYCNFAKKVFFPQDLSITKKQKP